jgi:hypothetical protein
MKKVIQKQILIDMMEQDEQLGLYQESLEELYEFEIEKIAMDKLKSKWAHLYTFGYPQKPFPTFYENDLNNIKIGVYEGIKYQQEQDKQEIQDLKDRLDTIQKSSEKVLQLINGMENKQNA